MKISQKKMAIEIETYARYVTVSSKSLVALKRAVLSFAFKKAVLQVLFGSFSMSGDTSSTSPMN